MTVAAKAGAHTLGVAFVRRRWAPEDVLQPGRTGWAFETDEMFDGEPGVETVTIEGPIAVAGPGDTESRRRIFVCQPKAGAEEACAPTNPWSSGTPRISARRHGRRPAARCSGSSQSGRRAGNVSTTGSERRWSEC